MPDVAARCSSAHHPGESSAQRNPAARHVPLPADKRGGDLRDPRSARSRTAPAPPPVPAARRGGAGRMGRDTARPPSRRSPAGSAPRGPRREGGHCRPAPPQAARRAPTAALYPPAAALRLRAAQTGAARPPPPGQPPAPRAPRDLRVGAGLGVRCWAGVRPRKGGSCLRPAAAVTRH